MRSCGRHLGWPTWHPIPHFWTESQVSVGIHIVSSSQGCPEPWTLEPVALPWHLPLFRRGHKVELTQSYQLEWFASLVGREHSFLFFLSLPAGCEPGSMWPLIAVLQPRGKTALEQSLDGSQNRRSGAVSPGLPRQGWVHGTWSKPGLCRAGWGGTLIWTCTKRTPECWPTRPGGLLSFPYVV